MPIKGIIFAYLTAAEVTAWFDSLGRGKDRFPYVDYVLCNGSNGSPDLRDRFVRVNGTVAGGTGGSDSSAHTHGSSALVAHVALNATSDKILCNLASTGFTADSEAQLGAGVVVASTDVEANGSEITGNTDAASATENRPAYYELVAVMRVR